MVDMSFLPEDYIVKRAQRRTNIFSLVLFAVVMSGVIAAFMVTDQQRRDLRGLQQTVNNEFQEVANRLEQLDQLQARKQQMLNKARITASLIEPIPRTVILAELINNMPKTMSLLEFKLDQKIIKKRVPRPKTAIEKAKRQLSKNRQSAADALNSALTQEIHDSEIKLQLTGVATTDVQVAQFMAALNNVPLFDDLSLRVSEDAKINKEIMRKFTVELRVDGKLSAAVYKPSKVSRELQQNPMGEQVDLRPGAEPATEQPADDSNQRRKDEKRESPAGRKKRKVISVGDEE